MKISVVMQSYLGHYPGARSRPKEKFVRAINCFLSQTYKDKELIIVSDGCKETKKIYDLIYKDNPLIKFRFLSRQKNEKLMYVGEKNSQQIVTYRRGKPRRIGNEMASGDLVCYYDTDDIMLPNRLSDIYRDWKDKPKEIKWSSNPIRIMHLEKWKMPKDEEQKQIEIEKRKKLQYSLERYGIYEPFYVEVSVPRNYIAAASAALVHRRKIKTKWEDSELITTAEGKVISGLTEDHKFLNSMRKNDDPKGFRQENICTVVCHYKDLWDV